MKQQKNKDYFNKKNILIIALLNGVLLLFLTYLIFIETKYIEIAKALIIYIGLELLVIKLIINERYTKINPITREKGDYKMKKHTGEREWKNYLNYTIK